METRLKCSLKPGVHWIVTIVAIAEKFVSDQMDTSLLAISAIAISGIGLGSIPAIASAIVTIVNDRNDHMDTSQRS